MTVILIAIALPAVLWAGLLGLMPSKIRYEMDWNVPGSFFSIYVIYRRLCNTVFWAGLVLSLLIAFVCRSEPAGILALSAVYALLVDIWMVYCYESYNHSKHPQHPQHREYPLAVYTGPTNYTASKYALTLSLAVSAIVLFVVGFLLAVTTIASTSIR